MRLKELNERIRDKTAVFTFGRMNPPTTGHEKLLNKLKEVANRNSADWYVFLSSTHDSKKNPLPFDRKIHYAKKMFGRDVTEHTFPQETTALHAASSIHGKGYKKLIMVVGSDRVNEFDKLLKTYNGQDKRHGFYEFDNIEVISAGERDPDAEGVAGMSASKLRNFAVMGQFEQFQQGLPGLSEKDAKSLFNEIRKGLKLQSIKEKLKLKSEVVPEKVSLSEYKFSDTFKTEKISEDVESVLRRKSEVSGIAYSILKSIYEKSVKKYKLGHEIGQVKEQFAIQQVNQHLLESKAMNDINEDFKLWMKMDEAQDVVVNTPTGRYMAKSSSASRTKNKERQRFRSAGDRNQVTVRRATGREKRYLDRESDIRREDVVFDEGREGLPTREYIKKSWKDRAIKSKERLTKNVSHPGYNEDTVFDEDAKMGKQSDDNLKSLHKKFSSMDLTSPANKHMHKRIEKEMKRRGTSEEAPPGREHQVKSLKKKVGEKKAYAFAWAQHNKHGLPEGTKLQVDMALSDAGIKGHFDGKNVNVHKKHVETAQKALKGNVYHKGKTPNVVAHKEEVVIEDRMDDLRKQLAIHKFKAKGGKIDKQPDSMENPYKPSKDDLEKAKAIAKYKQDKRNIKTHVSHNLRKSVTIPEETYIDEMGDTADGKQRLRNYATQASRTPTQGLSFKKSKNRKRFTSKAKIKGANEEHEYDGKVVKISKKDFTRVHRDFKNTTKGKERMMVNDPKTGGSVSAPVQFSEDMDISEAVALQCQECGKKFKKAKPGANTTCPKCKSGDIDLAETRKYLRHMLDEMSGEKAYQAADKAERLSRGNQAGMKERDRAKRKRQSQKFIDYSIRKTLKKEETLEEWDFDPNTLLQQLGGRKFMAMTGAKDLSFSKDESSLSMKIGKNSSGINHLKIILEPDDTYTMDFGRIRKLEYKVVRSVKGVYAEALQDVFTEITGMYTSL